MTDVDQEKERIRDALQELDHPTSDLNAFVAMCMLHRAAFSGDDDFKEEIFSARVIQVVMDVSRDRKAYHPRFYHIAYSILINLCSNNTELTTTFVANGGVEFLLECLETFSSDQFLLGVCFTLHRVVAESLDEKDSAAFAGMTLEKLVDAFELNYRTADGMLYQHYCVTVAHSFSPGREVDLSLAIERIAFHVFHGIVKHKHDEVAQDIGRDFLRFLVGEEEAKEMIDRAEMHPCEDPDCAGCA
jgi:hypothetical protein